MTEVHRTAACGFDAAAEVYERARPGYPVEAIEHVIDALRLRDAEAVLDLGAGTGKLTRELVARGIPCLAVEPVEGMRRSFAEVLPSTPCLEGTAEAIPLDAGTLDAIVIAQAFHWFRHDEALAEMHRVLRPGGRFALVWNVRDERHDWVHRITEIIRPYEGSEGVKIPRHRKMGWRAPLDASVLFTLLEQREFPYEQPMTVDMLQERVASTSFIAVLPRENHAQVMEAVRDLTRAHPDLAGKTAFAFPYITETFVYERV